MAKPKIASPYQRHLSLAMKIMGKPKANIGRESWAMESFPIPKTETNQAVTVVPTLAPIIRPTECSTVIKPAFTKLIIITVVAEEDCNIPVIPKPVRTPQVRLEVIARRVLRKRAPANFCTDSLITFIPKMKRPKAPIKERILQSKSAMFILKKRTPVKRESLVFYKCALSLTQYHFACYLLVGSTNLY